MMKKLIILSVMSLLVLGGCSKGESNAVSRPSHRIEPLDIQTSISQVRTPVEGSAFITGSELGIAVLRSADQKQYNSGYPNVNFKLQAQGWVSASTIGLDGTQGQAYAYYPYDPAITSIMRIPVAAGQTDYMWAVQSDPVLVSNASPIARFTMEHAMAMVSFKIYKNGYTGTGSLSTITIKDAQATTAFVKVPQRVGADLFLNAKDGAITGGTAGVVAFTNPDGSAFSTLVLGSTEPIIPNAQTIVVPIAEDTPQNAIEFSFTIDGTLYRKNVSPSVRWEAGHNYTYTVEVTDQANLVIGAVDVTEWVDQNGGQIEF